jgi:cobalt/nickel transport protein
VGAFGEDEGYDSEVGLKAEIIPLTRPYGLYATNVFQGLVKFNGKPVPFCEVEVEYLNEGKRVEAPNEHFMAQRLKTDQNGVFTFSAPWSGWWGFAALQTAPEKLQGKDVEVGAVIWVYFSDIPVKKFKK